MVHVASFAFQFMSVQQLSDCPSFFEQEIHPASRRPMPAETLTGIHGEAQLWLEGLPMHLLEDPKRRKVVEDPSRALQLIDEGKS
jgi:hypothetical protein